MDLPGKPAADREVDDREHGFVWDMRSIGVRLYRVAVEIPGYRAGLPIESVSMVPSGKIHPSMHRRAVALGMLAVPQWIVTMSSFG